MAKEDFCFTYYDGDAARDTTHMNRLERGCYHDLVLSQRKFGRLTLDQIKKVLGKDFTECWPSIELIMKTDADKFYIEWLDNSIIKARKHSRHQSKNGSKGGRGNKKEANINPKESQSIANINPNNNELKPLGDGDGNGDEYVIKYTEKESEKITEETDIHLDDTLMDVKLWTEQALNGNDYRFPGMIKDLNLGPGVLSALARDHLGKCARYGWHEKMTSQQAFRESLKNYLTENRNKVTENKTNGISQDKLEQFRKR